MYNYLRKIKYLGVLIILILNNNSTYANIKVRISKTEKQHIFSSYQASGKISYVNSQNFYAPNNGFISIINNYPEGRVKKGDLLVAIDQEIAESQLTQANNAFLDALKNYENEKKLFARQMVSENTFQNTKQLMLDRKTALEKATQIYKHMVITAPFDGYVGATSFTKGDQVTQGSYIVSVTQEGPIEIIASISQKLIGQINSDSKIEALDLQKNTHQARLLQVSNYVNKENGNFTLKAQLEFNPLFIDGNYHPILIYYHPRKALIIPQQALLQDEGGFFIFKATKDNKAQKNYVELGTQRDNWAEVVSGKLKTGDQIIIEGLTKISDQDNIEIIE